MSLDTALGSVDNGTGGWGWVWVCIVGSHAATLLTKGFSTNYSQMATLLVINTAVSLKVTMKKWEPVFSFQDLLHSRTKRNKTIHLLCDLLFFRAWNFQSF